MPSIITPIQNSPRYQSYFILPIRNHSNISPFQSRMMCQIRGRDARLIPRVFRRCCIIWRGARYFLNFQRKPGWDSVRWRLPPGLRAVYRQCILAFHAESECSVATSSRNLSFLACNRSIDSNLARSDAFLSICENEALWTWLVLFV